MMTAFKSHYTEAETSLIALAEAGGTPAATAALARFKAVGLPGRRVEEWKFSDLTAKLSEPLAAPATEQGAPRQVTPFDTLKAHRLVFQNGVFSAELSDTGPLPSGVALTFLGDEGGTEPSPEADALRLLNAALAKTGCLIEIAPDAHMDQPLLIEERFDGEAPQAAALQHSISVGAGAKAVVLTSYIGAAAGLVSTQMDVTLADNAALDHYIWTGAKDAEHAEAAHRHARASVRAEAGSRYHAFALVLNPHFARTEWDVDLAGPGADVALGGVHLLSDQQHSDMTSTVAHNKPHCTSRQVFKSVLGGRSRGVVQGKAFVAEDAQKTDGHQMMKALLVSPRAEADLKPELEIYADDVKCSHGATTGSLDEEAVFYLRSRGLPELEARGLLVRAFIADAFTEIDHEGVAEAFTAAAENWLETHPAIYQPAGREDAGLQAQENESE